MRPDGLPDDRVTCATCKHLDAETNWCRALRVRTIATVPFRCMTYVPVYAEPDQRTGAERWPTLKANIEEARAMDAARNANK